MRSITHIACFLLLGALAGIARAAEREHGNFAAEVVPVDKDQREYRLVVPKTVDLKASAPLVVAFHGFLIDSKDLMPVYTKLNETAEKHRFILVYPNALERSWGLTAPRIAKDLAFFDVLLKELSNKYKIDHRRIYLTGMSNGGYFAHLVAKERSTTIAAVACHSGALGLQTLGGIKAQRKFPVMIIHGDKDNIIPVAFARENRDKYKKEGHEVNYLEVSGLAHGWATDDGVNEKMWTFFSRHPMPK